MANALLQDLAAATTLAGTDLFYVKQAGARGVKATGTQLLALVGTAYVPLAGGTMTGALTISNGATTVLSADLSGYLRVGGVTTFEHKGLTASTGLLISSTSGYQTVRAYSFVDINNAACIGDTGHPDLGVSLGSARALQWSSSSGANSATADIYLYRDAAASLALRNGTNQQSFSVYNTYTDSSNYERLKLTGVAGTSVNIKAETLGTGGDNIDIVLTPAGAGSVVFPNSTYINSTGFGILSGIKCGTESSLNYYASGVRLLSSGEIAWTNTTLVSAAVDTALMRNAAGIVEVNNGTAGTWRDLKLRNLLQTAYQEVTEMTAPSAPERDSVRIYAEDNGSGKTRLMALFATGAAQQLAIEP